MIFRIVAAGLVFAALCCFYLFFYTLRTIRAHNNPKGLDAEAQRKINIKWVDAGGFDADKSNWWAIVFAIVLLLAAVFVAFVLPSMVETNP